MKIVVTGAAGSIGRRVCELLPLAVDDTTVLGLDRRPLDGAILGVDFKVVDLADAPIDDLLVGADVLVHLASGIRPEAASPEAGIAELAVTRRLLDGADRCGVSHLVVLSTAMVYGAWPNNPVPLTEQAVIRPNPELPFATQRAELERLALEWRSSAAERTLTILRPAVTVAEEKPGGLARLLRSASAIRSDAGEAPAQYLHAVDLSAAIVLGSTERVDGVLNVAPDGWINAEDLAALAGPRPRLRLPDWLTRTVSRARWRLGLSPTPPGLLAYTVHPWVISNDRLHALGWRATHTNEEAYVAGHAPGPLDMLNARRRQQIALGVSGVVIAGLFAGVGFGIWRLRRRRRDRAAGA